MYHFLNSSSPAVSSSLHIFLFVYFLLLTPLTVCTPRLAYFPVRFPVYPPMLSAVLVSGVSVFPMHLADILGSLLCSFSVEVYVGYLLDFIESQ